MLVMDGSNRDQCEVKRMRTNTPLQALVLLNDPVVLESSRVFAERLAQKNSTIEEKAIEAFRSIVARAPKPEELKVLLTYYEEVKKGFDQSPEKAREFIAVGEYPQTEIKDVASVAALMQVVHTIFNLEESITKV
jgi:hypothetical protein